MTYIVVLNVRKFNEDQLNRFCDIQRKASEGRGHSPWSKMGFTLFNMGFFEPSVMGGHEPPHHNFVVIAQMILKFGTDIKLHVFYTMVTFKVVTSLLLRNFYILTCILADA